MLMERGMGRIVRKPPELVHTGTKKSVQASDSWSCRLAPRHFGASVLTAPY
jgi:hypothetical protein